MKVSIRVCNFTVEHHTIDIFLSRCTKWGPLLIKDFQTLVTDQQPCSCLVLFVELLEYIFDGMR